MGIHSRCTEWAGYGLLAGQNELQRSVPLAHRWIGRPAGRFISSETETTSIRHSLTGRAGPPQKKSLGNDLRAAILD